MSDDLSGLPTPQEFWSRMLVMADYPEDDIRNALLDQFPEDDPDDLIRDARDWLAANPDLGPPIDISEANRRAVDAEHDITQTMHSFPREDLDA